MPALNTYLRVRLVKPFAKYLKQTGAGKADVINFLIEEKLKREGFI